MIAQTGHIVLTDFGLSKTGLNQKEARTATRCGTPYYVSPEIILGEEYTKAVDFWSLGVVLYEMLFGIPPFYSEDAVNIYKKIITNDYSIDDEKISEECQDFIESLLAEEVNHRLTEVEKIKSHPFFSIYDWERLKRQEITPPYIPLVSSPDDTQFFDAEILSSPIEHDDTEVSEYSDWTNLQEISPKSTPKKTSPLMSRVPVVVGGSMESFPNVVRESMAAAAATAVTEKESSVSETTNAQSDSADSASESL
jgi:serum/glucocorticoid-regulated kinase 2